MPDMKQVLRDRREQVKAEATTIASKATDENRALSPEEQGRFDGLLEEARQLNERLRGLTEQEAAAKAVDDKVEALRAGTPGQRGPQSAPGELGMEENLRSFLRGELGAPRSLTVAQSGTDLRTLSKLTAGAGANTVPTTFYDQLIQNMIETSAILRAGVRILNTSGGETIQIPKTTTHSTAAIVAEAATIGTSDPVFAQTSLGAYKYGVMVQVSRELLDDTGFDLQGYLAEETGRALGNALGAHLATGSGTNQPRGITTDSTLGVTTAAGVVGVPSYDNLVDLLYSVISPYRDAPNAAFLMKDTTVGALRKVKDSTGQPIWQPGMQQGAPDLLLGKRVFTDPFIPAAGLNANSVFFGDMSRYFVRLAGGVRFERSDEYAFNADLVTFRALLRADAALVDTTGAIKHIRGAAT